jgi:hypothetical protein
LLSSDERYPLEFAQETMDTYAAKVDPSTLELEYTKSEDYRLIFKFVGENGFQHDVSVSFGDGQIYVRDHFRPN